MTNELPSEKVHFSPASGWINDPNGLVYFDGEYHLFYQHHPDSLVWGPMHWGHAVSRDLITWQELDIALYPGVEGTCFSGSAVFDQENCSGLFGEEGGLVALYTSHLEQTGFDRGYLQQQCLAYSADAGRSWTKYAQNPVISSPGISDFRDPKVIWHQATKAWIQLLAVGQEIHFYRSTNLIDWQFVSRFGAGQGAHSEGAWECPDLVELSIEGEDETRWVLIVGMVPPMDPLGSFTQYFVGDSDGREFTNLNPSDLVLRMDWGRDFYAAQTWSNAPQKRTLVIAWMSNWHYANEVPAQHYRGNMTLVRELALRRTPDGIRLIQTFVLPSLAEPEALNIDLDLESGSKRFTGSAIAGPRTGQLRLRLDVGSRVELSFFGTQAQLRLEREASGSQLWIIRQSPEREPSFAQRFDHQYSIALGDSDEIEISWVTDLNTLEVLLNQGSVAVTQLVLEGSYGEPLRLDLLEGRAQLISFGECLL